jgi:hypothetical protein
MSNGGVTRRRWRTCRSSTGSYPPRVARPSEAFPSFRGRHDGIVAVGHEWLVEDGHKQDGVSVVVLADPTSAPNRK